MLGTKFVNKRFQSNLWNFDMNTSRPKGIVTTDVSKTRFAFILVISLVLLGGFSNNLNSGLIPHLKKAFTLRITQPALVDSRVYGLFPGCAVCWSCNEKVRLQGRNRNTIDPFFNRDLSILILRNLTDTNPSTLI